MKEALPFTLAGIKGLIDSSPNNKSFLVHGSNAYFAYTFANVEDIDPLRTKDLYFVARNYGLRALFGIEYKSVIEKPFPEFESRVKKLGKSDVPALFWATISWLNYIRYNLGDMQSYIDVAKAEAMAIKLLELDETYYFGTPHAIMGCYLASIPEMSGGNPVKAKEHFEKAIAISKGKFLMHQMFYARFYAVRVLDKDLYLKLLTEVKNAPEDILPSHCAVTNMCKMKADKLFKEADKLF
jgi:hypothetical protein